MFRIGEFSKMSMTTIKTLRYYEEEGLIKPEGVDKFTGYRLYTTSQLVDVHKIQSLRQLGLSIAEIRGVLSKSISINDILNKRKQEVVAELAYGQEQLSRIEFMLKCQEENVIMSYQAIIKELPECIFYSMETVIESYDKYFELIPPLGEKVMKKYPDLKCATPEYCFVKYLDGEYRDKDIHIEYCEAVNKIKPDFDNIKFKEINPVKAVSVMHKGPYSNLTSAYAFAVKWIDDNGYIISDVPRESYIDGIWNKESEEDWLTEIQIPIIKK